MADPAAWAVTAFGTTSFMLGMFQSGLLNNAGVLIVLPAAFFFGGLVQIIVAVLEISRGNLFGAAVFGTYGPFWVMFGAFIPSGPFQAPANRRLFSMAPSALRGLWHSPQWATALAR